ncbi:winged helix-turn-helix domain-containing protein [Alkalilimnicola sp. S0819]|uniref:winged helix-turn-helix domain-containing protein n=1 Tax=Alkalilimnicola sp. S0819 TaxID=2613922 RepID=UPI0012629C47|nr:winged helix-turn-helix domain-containing protein [Alkalilimnicola sp. S0819]KAB7624122.1 helix-turn-helix domain-containing protein [Alkalilimnicola sp. S0819]MPQ16374.1 helix-turn-helix domain-containing protein [Alkalilimnicola sp. S0819]
MSSSKTRTSFYRRLYVAHLIDTGIASVPQIMAATGMPRRTAQDTISALAELDIACVFEQQAGARNRSGSYRIEDWGAIDPRWVGANLARIKAVLGYP